MPRHEKTLSSGLVNNKGTDQLANPCTLISAFVFRSLESIISRLVFKAIYFINLKDLLESLILVINLKKIIKRYRS